MLHRRIPNVRHTPYLVVHVCFVRIHLQRDTGLLELLYVAALVFGLQTPQAHAMQGNALGYPC
jgi:hypothetical protein